MDGRIIERLKKRVGTRNDEEINELALACVKELENTGVYGDPATDALYYQAMVLYCKANFGYDENTERFQTAFEKLRDVGDGGTDSGKRIERPGAGRGKQRVCNGRSCRINQIKETGKE